MTTSVSVKGTFDEIEIADRDNDPNNDPDNSTIETFILIGDLPRDLSGNITVDNVTALLDDPASVGVELKIPNVTEFGFAVRLDEDAIIPIDTDLITVGFEGLKLGLADVAAFISLGLYDSNGNFGENNGNNLPGLNFAGGIDVEIDVDGIGGSVGVTLDGTGEGTGIFPNPDSPGARIVTNATIDFDFTTPADLPGFYLDVKNAQANFQIELSVDENFVFSFDTFELNNISVERLTAAFGGSPPSEGENSIPDDALLLLMAEPANGNPAVTFSLDKDAPALFTFGKVSAELPSAPAPIGRNGQGDPYFLGPVTIEGSLTVKRVADSLIFQITGVFDVKEIGAATASIVITEYGISSGYLILQTDVPLPLGPVELRVGGGMIRFGVGDTNPPATALGMLDPNSDSFKLTDIFGENSGVTGPSDLVYAPGDQAFENRITAFNAQLLSEAETIVLANQQLAIPQPTWESKMMIGLMASFGVPGIDSKQFLADLTIGAFVDPAVDRFQLFGLGSAKLGGKKIGTIGALLTIDPGEFQFQIALETPPSASNQARGRLALPSGDTASDLVDSFPAQLRVGLDFRGDKDSLEIIVEGEAKILEDLMPTTVTAVGAFAFVPEGFYGYIGLDVDLGTDDFGIAGTAFVQLNTTGVPQEFLLSEGPLAIPDGFALHIDADVNVFEVFTASGSLDITLQNDRFTAALDLEGTMLGLTVAANGELVLFNNQGNIELESLDFGASINLVIVPGFLEAGGQAAFAFDRNGFQGASIEVQAILFGFSVGPLGAAIDGQGCMTVTAGDLAADFPMPGGVCGGPAVEDVPILPTVSVLDAEIVEGDRGTTSVSLPVHIDNPRPDKSLLLEYTAFSSTNDRAQRIDDYQSIFRRSVVVAPGIKDILLDLTVVGDPFIESDETYSVYLRVLPPSDDQFSSGRIVGSGIGTVTILNDDVEAEPPPDAVVFYDFDLLDSQHEDGVVFETGPDASRPEFTFDLARVSPLSQTTDIFIENEGLPRRDILYSKAATALNWKGAILHRTEPNPLSTSNINIDGEVPV